MESRLQRSAVAIGHLLSHHAIQLGVVVVALLVLFGSVPGGRLLLLLALIVSGRVVLIGAEALRKRFTDINWRAAVEERRRRYVEPRPGRELFAECVGIVSFGLLLPLGYVLFTRDIVSLRCGYGVTGSAVAVLCLALYAWPHRWAPIAGVGERRSLWWILPAVPASALVYAGVTIHHPYLDPRRDDRLQLAAERVLGLDSNVVAGMHADWVFAYAEELATRGEIARAAALYRRGLHLAPRAEDARRRLAVLEARLDPRAEATAAREDPRPRARGLSADEFAHLPLWDGERPFRPFPSCRIDEGLESVPRTTVVLVTVGAVPAGIVEAVGDAILGELDLPVCRVDEPMPLPAADRIRGIVFGRQWNVDNLVERFLERSQPMPEVPLKYLLLTGADIYANDSNFVFSRSMPLGAVLSYARFGDPNDEWELVRHRTAKQALGALVKTFDLAPAADPNCVTSYSNGLPQFDAKGNRPTADTFRRFRERVDAQDARWRAHQGASTTGMRSNASATPGYTSAPPSAGASGLRIQHALRSVDRPLIRPIRPYPLRRAQVRRAAGGLRRQRQRGGGPRQVLADVRLLVSGERFPGADQPPSSASSALASFRSAVSNPSVNQS